ncbi:glycoside hydrolase [Streptomyces sp. CB02488]|uniref:RICIN domain-containing protein n=1 Tax=Streptomyces sp. CB02488 TaxID=1703920 RepID=UPI00093BCED4|nr:RICIN domain-containing protein [Streptomyces sp. CB02488]OKK23383.1 glycoside hydrolase [Streptomyces sp. CB02488]
MLARILTSIRRLSSGVLTLLAAAAMVLVAVEPAHADATSAFTPGKAWTDSSGRTLQMHGLGIVEVGSAWYAFGENKTGESSADTSFQSIDCYRSTDLSHWTYQRTALSRQADGDLGPGRVVERPKVLYNASTDTYVMYLHIDSPSYGEAKVGVATSRTPCGAYDYRGSSRPLGAQSKDIGVFQDTDGSGYLMRRDPEHGLRIEKLSSDYLTVTGTVRTFPDYESPAMVKSGGRYYLLASNLTGWRTNDNVYATGTSLSGPWTPFRTFAPPGTMTYNSQTANIIPVQGTAATTFIYAGDRWNTGDLGSSPLVWLPLTISGTTVTVSWQNSWTLDTGTGTWTGTSNPADAARHLTSAASGHLMDVSGGATANGTGVIQWPSTGGPNQRWALHRIRENVYTLVGADSGKCLEVPGRSAAQGTRLDVWTCDNGTNQQWALQAAGTYSSSSNASYALVNLSSGLVADVAKESTAPGAALQQWAATGGTNQIWSLN